MSRRPPSLSQVLTRRLVLLAGTIFLLNSLAVGVYYGSDRRGLEAEVVARQTERIQREIDGSALPREAPVRRLYEDNPDAYAFALVDRGGELVEVMNPGLIPPGATDQFADDWITRLNTPGGRLIVAGHEFEGRADGLRMVFVMRADPARLAMRAYLAELYGHVWLPILPLVLLLIGANMFLIRQGVAPIAAAAAWARAIQPGAAAPPPPPVDKVPAEIADLIDATRRSLDRLTQALTAEKRRAAEAAHALRTPVAVLMARLDALPSGETADRLRSDLLALSRTVQQVLASARADALTTAEHGVIDLREPAQAATAALAPFAYTQGIELALDLPDRPVTAIADGEAVELALTNLVENAILHGRAGPVEIKVGPGACVTIRDFGPGLPLAGPGQMFDPFWRGPDAAPGGAGLGLAIVDRLQQALGGRVIARNADGGGAEFILTYRTAEN